MSGIGASGGSSNSDGSLAFPWWVVRKDGIPLLLETEFAGTFPNTKFGVLVGSGTVSNDTTNLKYGGTGCAKMTTAAVNLDGSEIKTTIAEMLPKGDLLAFEFKWAQSFAQGTTEFNFGLESRSHTAIRQARFSWTNATGQIQYESAAGVYSPMSNINASYPNATIENPAVNLTAGTPVSWARVVIDPYAATYYSFECPIVDGSGNSYDYTWDMRTVPLTANGVASRALYLPFTYVITHSATAESGYSTDWCMSQIKRPYTYGWG